MILPPMRVALISKQENTCGYYVDLLSSKDNITFESYTTVDEFKRGCRKKQYSGFIIDMWTHIGSANIDKEFIYSLDKVFPILYTGNHDQEPSTLDPTASRLISKQHDIEILNEFIQNKCRKMPPQGIRVQPRKHLFFNTWVRFSNQEKSFMTNTWNISREGCFIIATQNQPAGEQVWLTICDLSNKTPIAGEIVWNKSWGNDFHSLPGMGVIFKSISSSQQQEIVDYLIS